MSRLLHPEYKVVMLGTGGVGKSMITTRYINGNFSNDYDPTIEDSYRKECTLDNRTCVLEILDTAGQEEYIALRDYHIRSGDCFVVVYSITDPRSLDEAEVIVNQVYQTKESALVPIVIVGNKTDRENDRKVATTEGREVAKRMGTGFYEVSAKTGHKIGNIFTQCVRRIRHFEKQKMEANSVASGKSTAQHSRQPSGQQDKNSTKEKPRSSSKSWLPGRKSVSKSKSIAEISPVPQVTMLPKPQRTDSNIPDYYLSNFSEDSPAAPSAPFTPMASSIRRRTENSSPVDSKLTKAGGRGVNDLAASHNPNRRSPDTLSAPPPRRVQYTTLSDLPSKRMPDTRSAPPPPRNKNGYTDRSLGQQNPREEAGIPSLKRSLGTDTDRDEPPRNTIDKNDIKVIPYGSNGAMDLNKALPKPRKSNKRQKRSSSTSCTIL
ncbi:RAS1 protein [Coemansia sp. Benny D115]|nr:RAS1 protein [Coemansia sp. Benny D115]